VIHFLSLTIAPLFETNNGKKILKGGVSQSKTHLEGVFLIDLSKAILVLNKKC